MTFASCTSFEEVDPTLEDVKKEISDLVGMEEIKKELETIAMIVEGVKENQSKENSHRIMFVPPKPFHMVFVGNNGTGKSTVARIIGKLFYLAHSLPNYGVTEMHVYDKISDANGGVLLVNVEEGVPINSKSMEEISSAMDEGKILMIFAGTSKALNKCMTSNKYLYHKSSVRLQFEDFTCEELARIMEKKGKNGSGDNSLIGDFNLHASCNIDNITQIMSIFMPENIRSAVNARGIEQMLVEARKSLEGGDEEEQGEKIIYLNDLARGIQIVVEEIARYVTK